MRLADDLRLGAVLLGAAGRARAQLRDLDLSQRDVTLDDLLPVLTSNAGSLRVLHLHNVEACEDADPSFPSIEAVVAAAPLLQVRTAELVYCLWEDAPRVLRGEPPFALLRLRGCLIVNFSDESCLYLGGPNRLAPFAPALADPALQPALLGLCVQFADTAQPAFMGALVDAVLTRRLRKLSLQGCTPPAAAPLARLLTEGSVDSLELVAQATVVPLFDTAGAALVADALRVNTTLTELKLCDLSQNMCVAESVLAALVGHRSLRELQVVEQTIVADNRCAKGDALAALIATDSPALHVLVCVGSELGDAGLAPIVEALPLNRHLRELDVRGNDMSEGFAREQLLPALRANTTLFACGEYDSGPATTKADELVRRRVHHG